MALSTSSATHIRSPLGIWIGRILVLIILISTILFEINLVPQEILYFQSLTADFDSVLGTIFVWGVVGIRAILALIFVISGLLLYWRKPDNRMVLITAIWMIAFAGGGITFTNAVADPGEYLGDGLNQFIFYANGSLAWGLLFLFFWIFPDGRVIPRWGFVALIFSFGVVFAWAQSGDSPLFPNNWPGWLFALIHLALLIAPIIGQIQRYQNYSSATQRQQTKWAIFTFSIALSIGVLGTIIPAVLPDIFVSEGIPSHISLLISDIGFIGIPIGLSFALMRSRLWDVDIVINRSLVYGAIAGLAILIFLGVLVSLQVILGQQQPAIALVIAVIVSAVVYKPLSQRVQSLVDRHIYGLRFNLNELQAVQKAAEITNAGQLTGKVVNGYEIRDVIGKGGMGEVYLAIKDNEQVAIKTLLASEAQDHEMLQRFQREATTGQSLDHPNIAKVSGSGAIEGTPYLIMEYIPGSDLRTLLKAEGKLDEETTVTIIKQLCSALDVAHAQGFVHRDIKPANIMLRENGEAVLMDFGVTKVKEAHTITGTGAIGTIDYMAPEQIMSAKTVDNRADIYALGIVAYELLTGEKPFTGSAAQVMFAHIQQPPPYARDVNPTIPKQIADAIEQAMAKDPDDRFDSAEAFAKTLNF